MNKQLTSEEEKLLETLSSKERCAVQKDNPYRKERNKLIHDLAARGVKGSLLEKISGLSKSTISRIKSEKDYDCKSDFDGGPKPLDSKKIKMAIKAFYKELLKILNYNVRR